MPLRKNLFENIVGKGENAGYSIFYSMKGKLNILSNIYFVIFKYS